MVTVRCRKCGNIVPSSSVYCSYCGFPLASSHQKPRHETAVLDRGNRGRESHVPQTEQGQEGRQISRPGGYYKETNADGSLQRAGIIHDQQIRSQGEIQYKTSQYGTAQPYVLYNQSNSQENSRASHKPDRPSQLYGTEYYPMNTKGYEPATAKLYDSKEEEIAEKRRESRKKRKDLRKEEKRQARKELSDIVEVTSGVHRFLGQLLLFVSWNMLLVLSAAYILWFSSIIMIGELDFSIDVTTSPMGMHLLGVLAVFAFSYLVGRLSVNLLKINAEIPTVFFIMLSGCIHSLQITLFYPFLSPGMGAVIAAIGTAIGLLLLQPVYKKPGMKRILWACLVVVVLFVILSTIARPQLIFLFERLVERLEMLFSPIELYGEMI